MSSAPVFVVGSARSGTTLLYHMLLSAGGFANYRTEPAVFDLLLPKFGDFSKRKNRQRLMQVWMRSYQFRISGLDRQALEPKVVSACRSGGDFLRVVMDEIAWRQQVSRWAVWGPDNLLHMADIASELPDALFLHIVRDGRDVALSMSKEGWIRPFPWDRQRGLLVAALHWQWKVRYGRRSGRALKHRYLEVRFEDLLTKPEDTLSTIGRFIDQPLNYATIQREAIGTLKDPNSTFRNSGTDLEKPNPVGRWKKALSESDIAYLRIPSVLCLRNWATLSPCNGRNKTTPFPPE